MVTRTVYVPGALQILPRVSGRVEVGSESSVELNVVPSPQSITSFHGPSAPSASVPLTFIVNCEFAGSVVPPTAAKLGTGTQFRTSILHCIASLSSDRKL